MEKLQIEFPKELLGVITAMLASLGVKVKPIKATRKPKPDEDDDDDDDREEKPHRRSRDDDDDDDREEKPRRRKSRDDDDDDDDDDREEKPRRRSRDDDDDDDREEKPRRRKSRDDDDDDDDREDPKARRSARGGTATGKAVTREGVRRLLRDKSKNEDMVDPINKLLKSYDASTVQEIADKDLADFHAELKALKAPR